MNVLHKIAQIALVAALAIWWWDVCTRIWARVWDQANRKKDG